MLTPSLIQDINHNSLHCSGFDSPNDPHTNIIVNFTLIDKGSFALGDDDDDKKKWVAWIPMGLFALGNHDKMQYNDIKLQCDDIIVHWVQYPFHDDVIKCEWKSTLSLQIHFVVVA